LSGAWLEKNPASCIDSNEMCGVAIKIRMSDSSPHPPRLTDRIWIGIGGNTKQEGGFIALH
jgi:hypothetical protein